MLSSLMVHHCTLKLYHPLLYHQQPFNYIYFVLIHCINSMSSIGDDSQVVVSSSVIYVILCCVIAFVKIPKFRCKAKRSLLWPFMQVVEHEKHIARKLEFYMFGYFVLARENILLNFHFSALKIYHQIYHRIYHHYRASPKLSTPFP